jgi:hypothetical protein
MTRLLTKVEVNRIGYYFATLERVGMDELGIRIKKSSISLRKTGLHITYMMLRKN